jgi:hypothetical protein
MYKLSKYYKRASGFQKTIFWAVVVLIVLPNLIFFVVEKTIYVLPSENGFSLQGRTVLYTDEDKTKLVLDRYSYDSTNKKNSATSEVVADLTDPVVVGNLTNYAIMRDENYVFVTYATTTLNLYKVKNQKVTLIKTLPLIDLDMWDKDYRAGKAELTQDLKDGSIYANNYYLTVDNKNNLFGFYDNMIEKVGDKKVVEVSERRRMFDLDGNERERDYKCWEHEFKII